MLKVNFKFSLFLKDSALIGKLEEKLDFVATRKKSALPLYQKIISTSNSIYMPSFMLVSQNAQFIPLTAGLSETTRSINEFSAQSRTLTSKLLYGIVQALHFVSSFFPARVPLQSSLQATQIVRFSLCHQWCD